MATICRRPSPSAWPPGIDAELAAAFNKPSAIFTPSRISVVRLVDVVAWFSWTEAGLATAVAEPSAILSPGVVEEDVDGRPSDIQ